MLVGGWSLDTRTVVSTKSGAEKLVLIYVRSRDMVCTHPSTGKHDWRCSNFRLLIDRRSVIVSVHMQKAEASQHNILGYVPYQMWVEANPGITMLLQNMMRSFRHELLVSNFKGIPIMQQHGSADNNVPAFHSRRMNQLISQMNGDFCHQYVELKGKSHWFEGVMTTIPLLGFYDILGRGADWPQLPQTFTMMVGNPAEMGARGGLLVDQLITPDQLGRVEVARCPTSATWVLRTSNILRLHFIATKNSDTLPHELVIDQSVLELPPGKEKFACWIVRSEQGFWHVRNVSGSLSLRVFNPKAYFLRHLLIVNGS